EGAAYGRVVRRDVRKSERPGDGARSFAALRRRTHAHQQGTPTTVLSGLRGGPGHRCSVHSLSRGIPVADRVWRRFYVEAGTLAPAENHTGGRADLRNFVSGHAGRLRRPYNDDF